nr:hypothetical transcript [Hymenolepis microstoma]
MSDKDLSMKYVEMRVSSKEAECQFGTGEAKGKNKSQTRNLANLATGKTHYKVLITGGGTAGCAVAAKLRNVVPDGDIGVIEPEEHHYYQGAFTLVGAGIMGLQDTRISMMKAIPGNAEWIRDRVEAYDPLNNKVTTVGGKQITYDYLVMCLGMKLRYDMICGAEEALKEDPRVCSNYSKNYVEKTFKAFQDFNGGTAIFTLPNTPIKCAGAPLKVMYLFEDYLARVDHKRSIVVIEDLETKERQEYNYDFLHLTPPMSAPEELATGPDLSSPDSKGYVTVNPETLRHIKYENIFALGDCSNLPTSRTAAAVSSESHVLCANLTDVIKGGPGEVAKYNGYTSCPLITGYWKGILAEFDYKLTPMETFPIDQSQERAFFAWFKRTVLPPLYWNGLIKGSWDVWTKLLDERLNDATKIKRKYPDRIPVIVERHPGSQINDLDKHKFLVPNDITVAQFMWIIRKRLQLPAEKALFLFFDDFVPQSSWTMGQLYNERKSDDGFLYAHYSGENSFGSF